MRGLGGKIFGLLVSIGLILGGLSGKMVLRGTDSSTALIVLGVILLILDVISLVTHKKEVPEEQAPAGNAPASEEGADGAIAYQPEQRRENRATEDAAMSGNAFPFRVFLLQLLALFFYTAVIFVPNHTARYHFQPCLGTLVLGIGFYLVYRGGRGRGAGILGLFLLGLAMGLRTVYAPQTDGTLGIFIPALPVLLIGFIDPALMALIGFIGSGRKKIGPYFGTFVTLAACATLLVELILHWSNRLFSQRLDVIVMVAALTVLFSLAIIPAGYLARAFQEKGGQRLGLSVITRLWCALVFLGTSAAFIYNITEQQPAALQSLLLLPATLGMFILMLGFRTGFHLAVVGVGFVILQTLAMLVRIDGVQGQPVGTLVAAGINLLITWLLIRRAPVRAAGADNPEAIGLKSHSDSPLQRTPVAIPSDPALAKSALPPPPAGGDGTAAQRAQFMKAALAVFNNSFSPMVYDPTDTLWKEPIQTELDVLVLGGKESASVLEELLMRCARGNGSSISKSWWYGGKWAVKAVALLPREAAPAPLLLRLLRTDSNVVEWFTYIQAEAAAQIAVVGSANELPALQGLLSNPMSMSPISEIAKAITKIGGEVKETPAVILAKAQNQLGDADGIEYLLPFMNKLASWASNEQGFYYYLLANKSNRLGYKPAARAFFAAQVAACPNATSFGWQEFLQEGIKASPENALELGRRYPTPTTMEEIKAYAVH